MTPPLKACGRTESGLDTSCLSLPVWAHHWLRLFQGRSQPRQQCCTAGRNMKAGLSMWSRVQEGSWCCGLIVQHYRGTMLKSHRKGSDVISLPSFTLTMLWNLIWLVSLHCQWWNLPNYIFSSTILLVYFHIHTYDSARPEAWIPSPISCYPAGVCMRWSFLSLMQSLSVKQQVWKLVQSCTAASVFILRHNLTHLSTCWQYSHAHINDACVHCFNHQERPHSYWNQYGTG